MNAHGGHQSVYEGMKCTGTDCDWIAVFWVVGRWPPSDLQEHQYRLQTILAIL